MVSRPIWRAQRHRGVGLVAACRCAGTGLPLVELCPGLVGCERRVDVRGVGWALRGCVVMRWCVVSCVGRGCGLRRVGFD